MHRIASGHGAALAYRHRPPAMRRHVSVGHYGAMEGTDLAKDTSQGAQCPCNRAGSMQSPIEDASLSHFITLVT